jgi:hypothetical protein
MFDFSLKVGSKFKIGRRNIKVDQKMKKEFKLCCIWLSYQSAEGAFASNEKHQAMGFARRICMRK